MPGAFQKGSISCARVYELEKKMIFSFNVLEALVKHSKKVIEMIKDACTSEKCNFLAKLEFLHTPLKL